MRPIWVCLKLYLTLQNTTETKIHKFTPLSEIMSVLDLFTWKPPPPSQGVDCGQLVVRLRFSIIYNKVT